MVNETGHQLSGKESVAIIVSNNELRIIWCNIASESFFGLEIKDIIEKMTELLNLKTTQSDIKTTQSDINQILKELADKEQWYGETPFTLLKQTLTNLHVSISVLKNETGYPTCIVTLIEHVSERQVFQPAQKFVYTPMEILDTMKEGACIINQHYEIVYQNPALTSICGQSYGNKCYQHLFARSDICPWCDRFEIQPAQKREWKSSFTRSGRTYEYQDSSIVDSRRNPCKLRIFHEVTEYTRIEEDYLDYRRQIEDTFSEHISQLDHLSRGLKENINRLRKHDISDHNSYDH